MVRNNYIVAASIIKLKMASKGVGTKEIYHYRSDDQSFPESTQGTVADGKQ